MPTKIFNVTLEQKWEVEPWIRGKLLHCFSCTLCVNGMCSPSVPGAPPSVCPQHALCLYGFPPTWLLCTILTAPAPVRTS